MIPAFLHCSDCGSPAQPIAPAWGGAREGYWWCRLCRAFLLPPNAVGEAP